MSDVREEIELWFAMNPDGPATDERQMLSDAADEIETLSTALAASCEGNRSVALAEPGRTATCPLERELRQEVERLRGESMDLRRQLDDVATLAGARLMGRKAGGE